MFKINLMGVPLVSEAWDFTETEHIQKVDKRSLVLVDVAGQWLFSQFQS